jgi:NAD(P)H-nitrite reductase large subunit
VLVSNPATPFWAFRSQNLSTVPEVARATAATTGCGSCAGEVEELLAGFASGGDANASTQTLEPAHVE